MSTPALAKPSTEPASTRSQMPASALIVFLREAVRSMPETASFFPSSRRLASALVRQIDFKRANTIVELGAGTGSITCEILRRMGQKCVLYALDSNPRFIRYIARTICDRRLVPIVATAHNLTRILKDVGVDGV